MKYAITYTHPSLQHQAQLCAERLQLPFVPIDSLQYPYLLVLTDTHWEIRSTEGKLNPIYVDFLSSAAQFRRQHGGGKGQLIAKAVGVKAAYKPSVLDVTAGLGARCICAGLFGVSRTHGGAPLPSLALLLEDGLQRLTREKNLALSLTTMDALSYLKSDPSPWEVIYLDPMFPIKTKTALAKKEMRLLRDIVGEDLDAATSSSEQTLQHAQKKSRRQTPPPSPPPLTHKNLIWFLQDKK